MWDVWYLILLCAFFHRMADKGLRPLHALQFNQLCMGAISNQGEGTCSWCGWIDWLLSSSLYLSWRVFEQIEHCDKGAVAWDDNKFSKLVVASCYAQRSFYMISLSIEKTSQVQKQNKYVMSKGNCSLSLSLNWSIGRVATTMKVKYVVYQLRPMHQMDGFQRNN